MFDINIGLESRGSNEKAGVTIIPGNLNSSHPTKKCIFQQLLPLEADGREGQLHREIQPFDEVGLD